MFRATLASAAAAVLAAGFRIVPRAVIFVVSRLLPPDRPQR